MNVTIQHPRLRLLLIPHCGAVRGAASLVRPRITVKNVLCASTSSCILTVNIHSTHVLPRRVEVVAAYMRAMNANLYGRPLRGPVLIPVVLRNGCRPAESKLSPDGNHSSGTYKIK